MSYITRGFGATADQYVSAGGAVATPIVSGVLASSSAASVAAGGSGLILGMAPSLAIPVVGAAIVAAMAGIELILHSGCGNTCVVTSNWANEAESKLRQLVHAYFSIPAPRTQSQQQATMQGFMAVWNYLSQECSNPQLGTAGQNCIADRQDGACKWKQTALLGIPGEPAIGQCFNWWAEYYWPVANDDTVPDAAVQDATSTSSSSASSDSVLSGLSGSWLAVLAVAGLLGLAVMNG